MNYLKWFLLFVFTIVFQGTLVNLISINGIRPDIVLLVLVFSTFHINRTEAIIFGFSVGLIQDLITGGIPGMSSLCKTISALIAYNLQHQKWYQFSFFRFLLVFLIVVTIHETVYFIIFQFGSGLNFWMMVLQYVLPSILYGIIMAILLFLIFPEQYFKMTKKIK